MRAYLPTAFRLPSLLAFPFLFALAVACSAQPPAARNNAQATLPVISLKIDAQALEAEVAQTPEQRERGLMYRFTLPNGHGMLFVFDRPQPLSFWMKNTPAALSIAFIDAQGVILNLRDMAPNDDQTLHRSQGSALYALEVRKGWFAEQGIKAGMRVEGLPPAAKQ